MDTTSTRRWLAPVYRNAIYVMRHGRTVLDDEHRSDGWLDYPLSDEGRIGLMHAQQYLKSAPLKHIYAPSLRRTAETAHILSSGILSHPDIRTAEEPRTWHLGILMGTKKKPNRPVVQFYMTHPDEKPEGGESLQHFHDRWIPWLHEIMRTVKEGNGPVLVITSGSNLRELSKTLTGDVDKFDLDEAGLMVLLPDGDTMRGQVIFGHKSEDQEWLS